MFFFLQNFGMDFHIWHLHGIQLYIFQVIIIVILCGLLTIMTTILMLSFTSLDQLFTPQPLRLEGIDVTWAVGVRNLVNAITLRRLPVSCCKLDVLYIKILDEFDIELYVTFLTF